MKPFIEIVAEYIVKTLKDKSTDDIVSWYVINLVIKNHKFLDSMIEYYKLPKKDILKMHSKLQEVVN